MAECKHGFEGELCDICFPQAVPEPVKVTRSSAPKRVAGARGAHHAVAAVPPSVTLATHRVYHVTHFDNLASILTEGILRYDADPEVDVSSTVTRELRSTAPLASGATAADNVPFYASPDATRWDELRSGAAGAHWSDAARSSSALDFVVLGVQASELGQDVIVADGDAASSMTKFAFGADAGTLLLRRAYVNDSELREVEVLVPHPVPFEAIALIGVANEKVRDRVKSLLSSSGGHAPKISVYPPWFQPSE